MKALVLGHAGPVLGEVPDPEAEVVVELAFAAVCRTDLLAAEGVLGVAPPRVLGHEGAGVVVSSRHAGAPVGARVALRPKGARGWLGLDVDGVFAERVGVDADDVVVLPESLRLELGAWVEPLAAATAVLEAPISPRLRGAVEGTDRIAELVRRVLAAKGIAEHQDGPLDFVVETSGTGEGIAASLARLRDGGLLVAKSRPGRAPAVPWRELVSRDLRVQGVSHGRFEEAARWLAEGVIDVSDLTGAPQPLSAWSEVFARAKAPSAKKQLFEIR